MTLSSILSDPEYNTPALKRQQIVSLFTRCGLGGEKLFEKAKATGTLKPLRNQFGAKQARYSRDSVFTLIRESFADSDTSAA